MIIYTNNLIPKNSAAITLGFIILIRPQYRNDAGLVAHERVHVAQFWRTLCLFPILYLLWPAYRLKSEVEAYKVQLKYAPDCAALFACFISKNYFLNISLAEALQLLEG